MTYITGQQCTVITTDGDLTQGQWLLSITDPHGTGITGNPAEPAGMEANVVGFPRGWEQSSLDFREDGKQIVGYEIPI